MFHDGAKLKKPDLPANEAQRLFALRSLNVLDTPNEERFDRITRMAQRLFNVDIAVVSLVDTNRQWFKSCIGLDATETSRDVSFCGHAILDDAVMVIENALEDERFRDNPLVLDEPKIRFYAGCPLKAMDGSKLGTLCLIDTEPRVFSDADKMSLKDLASMVESELVAIDLATQDELTGILNRRGFVMLAQHGLNMCVRENLPAVLVFFDLNRFKPINDQFGHIEGDRALTLFSNELTRVVRKVDLCARLGGDEFVVLLADADKQHAESILRRLSQNLSRVASEFQLRYAIDFSHGLVLFDPDRHNSLDALLIDGDRLMYQMKRQSQPKAGG